MRIIDWSSDVCSPDLRGPFIALRVRRRAPRALAVALRRSFVDLGPTFVKFGQLIASSPGLFPDVAATEFRSLLDEVPTIPTSQVHRIVDRKSTRLNSSH